MQIQALKITSTEASSSVDGALRTLKAVPGVAEALASPREGVVTVRFDEDRTSPQELRATLRSAGYDTQALDAPAVSGHTCCGGCGG